MIPRVDGIEAVAFDLDGTLIDTAPDLAAAANMMLIILGGRLVPEHRVPGLIGGGIEAFVAGVLRESRGASQANAALARTAAALFRDLYGQQPFERSRLYPGAMEVLRWLQETGIPVCCITNKESRFTMPLLRAAALHACFHTILCADRAELRKPSPTLLLIACTQLGIRPEKLLYVGDSPSDIAAARAAGCRVAVVAHGYNEPRDLLDARPDSIVGRLTELLSIGEVGIRAAG